MTVPDYQTLMRPVLAALTDGAEHQTGDLRRTVAERMGLTEADLADRLSSGTNTFVSRAGWTITYLHRAGLIERRRRSVYRITERGRDVLDANPQRIDNSVLREFEEFRSFQAGRGDSTMSREAPMADARVSETLTPQERMDAAHRELQSALAAELSDRIMDQSPQFFEQLVVDVLIEMGYGSTTTDAGQRLGRTGDGGIDGVIHEDRLGIDVIYLQAKRWSNSVGRPDVQAFVGALAGRGVSKGVFITTSTFTAEARAYADQVQARVVLVDGALLTGLMIEHGVGVARQHRYEVKRIDLDYFVDGEDAPRG